MEDCNGHFWLPSDFLSDRGCEALESRRPTGFSSSDSGSSSASPAETESDDEDPLPELTSRMSRTVVSEHVEGAHTMARSPQSILCDFSIWSDNNNSNKGSPTGSSSPLLPETLAAPVEEVALPGDVGLYSSPLLAEQQLQAVRLYHLKQKQLLKQQFSAAWGRQQQSGKGKGGGGRALGLPSSAWLPLQQQLPPSRQQQPPLPGSGMRAVFLTRNGTRKAAAGTGVFLPRRPGAPTESRRKQPGCSTVLLPDRVIQALNLNLDEVSRHARLPGGFLLDHGMDWIQMFFCVLSSLVLVLTEGLDFRCFGCRPEQFMDEPTEARPPSAASVCAGDRT